MKDRVTRTLYRQLLRSCNALDAHIPLSSFCPPLSLTAPDQLDAERLELLSSSVDHPDDAAVAFARRHLPPQSVLRPALLTVPIHDRYDLINVVRSIYRLNSRPQNEILDPKLAQDHHKKRVAVAFESLKSINELREHLQQMATIRARHHDRDGITFCIGQVVQHQHERWRGVIAAWERPGDQGDETPAFTAASTKTSLTTKSYTDATQHVRYDVILDAGDAHLMSSSTGWAVAVQADLVSVRDAALARIRGSAIGQHFDGYDRQHQCFVPNDLLSYQYPSDWDALCEHHGTSSSVWTESDERVCQATTRATQGLAAHIYEGMQSVCGRVCDYPLLVNVQERLYQVVDGDVLPSSWRFAKHLDQAADRRTQSQRKMIQEACAHLRCLLTIHLEVFDVNQQRRLSQQHALKMKFIVGDVVRHTHFDFRGVVVAWDHVPMVDVSRWDGVQHIDSPNDKPFYHVVPDVNDSIRAFGGERPLRYVCQDNLEVCPFDQRRLHVNIDDDWRYQSDRGSYAVPDGVRYKYGHDLGDDGITEQCMQLVAHRLHDWHTGAAPSTDALSLAHLHQLLLLCDNIHDASAVQESMKEMRKAHVNVELREQLNHGLALLTSGRAPAALQTFLALVEQDDGYAEAWNKVATCQYMLGQLDVARTSTEKVLALDAHHSPALAGLGLIHFEQNDYARAIDAFRQALAIDPWSPVASKLSISLDLQSNTVQRGETP